jgi:Dihaem cytochrome c
VHRTSTVNSFRFAWLLLALLATLTWLGSCKGGKIPDQGSEAAQLYVKRCGSCHQAYLPSLMTAEMWRTQVDLMQERMKQAGIAPLSPDERRTIIEYLSRHAGQQ